jgi:hypothetical protein
MIAVWVAIFVTPIFFEQRFRALVIGFVTAIIVAYVFDVATVRLVIAQRWRGWLLGYDV